MIDITRVVELLRERQDEFSGENSEYIQNWLDAKEIDKETIREVMSETSQEQLEFVLGKLMTTNNPEFIKNALFTIMGMGLELGYTISELQFERGFLTDDAEDN
jgi:hypothetical protein